MLVCAVFAVLLPACSAHYSHTNIRMDSAAQSSPVSSKASFNVRPDRGRDDSLVILAFSGGGSRAAYWSTSVMFKLQQVFGDPDLLAEVDAISSVSGGSLPAAYYAISTDEGDERLYGRVWQEKKVKRLMKKNYIMRWFGNWFWPTNIAKFWFTAYDRSDIMAQTFADNLYDKKPFGKDLRIGHINRERPYLILNATNGTQGQFGEPFTFTEQDFAKINSDINNYKLSRAVMATASFPAVFNYMTLENYAASDGEHHYTHVFDGGNVDNLGLLSVQRILDTLSENGTRYDKLVVILVDAYNDGGGVSSEYADSRNVFDFIVDSNFIDASDSLLIANREKMLRNFKKMFLELSANDGPKAGRAIFYHIQFSDIREDQKLRKKITRIKTNFKIKEDDAKSLDKAADILFTPENRCLQEIRALLVDNQRVTNPICSYTR